MALVPMRGVLKPVVTPLYRTSLFVDIDQGPPWQRVNRTPSVIGVLLTGDVPSRCPETEIVKLRAAEGPDGYVVPADVLRPIVKKFAIGERVKVTRGPLEGRQGVYAGPFGGRRKAQAKVAVNLLGRVIEVVIGVEALAAIG
jgi:transcription antitermination factor NusG